MTTESLQILLNGTARLREACLHSSECFGKFAECSYGVCKCVSGYVPRIDNSSLCIKAASGYHEGKPVLHSESTAKTTTLQSTLATSYSKSHNIIIAVALLFAICCVLWIVYDKRKRRQEKEAENKLKSTPVVRNIRRLPR